jgi:hypothetical protein
VCRMRTSADATTTPTPAAWWRRPLPRSQGGWWPFCSASSIPGRRGEMVALLDRPVDHLIVREEPTVGFIAWAVAMGRAPDAFFCGAPSRLTIKMLRRIRIRCSQYHSTRHRISAGACRRFLQPPRPQQALRRADSGRQRARRTCTSHEAGGWDSPPHE